MYDKMDCYCPPSSIFCCRFTILPACADASLRTTNFSLTPLPPTRLSNCRQNLQKHLEATHWPDSVGLLTEVLRFVSQSLELARGAGERDLLAVLLSATAAFRFMQDR